jgi:integrase
MSSVRIRRKSGRHCVLFRRGGRAFAEEWAGSFKTQKEAKLRYALVLTELAAGRDPHEALRRLEQPAPPARTLGQEFDSWLASRHDLSDTTRETYTYAKRALPGSLLSRPTTEITFQELQETFAAIQHSPSALKLYRNCIRQAFDYAGVQPNPARDKRFKLPKVEHEETNPPPTEHLLAILERVTPKVALFLLTLEQGCTRIAETLSVTWGDFDIAGSRLRLRARETKRSRARWVELPQWLTDRLAALCALEDRTADRRVFQGLSDDGVRAAMRRACTLAEIPHYHPHDLRHRRATIWHHAGMPAREVAHRGGWSRATVPLDTYSHTMPLTEAPTETLEAALVRTRCGPERP